jgi:hypothetical protein
MFTQSLLTECLKLFRVKSFNATGSPRWQAFHLAFMTSFLGSPVLAASLAQCEAGLQLLASTDHQRYKPDEPITIRLTVIFGASAQERSAGAKGCRSSRVIVAATDVGTIGVLTAIQDGVQINPLVGTFRPVRSSGQIQLRSFVELACGAELQRPFDVPFIPSNIVQALEAGFSNIPSGDRNGTRGPWDDGRMSACNNGLAGKSVSLVALKILHAEQANTNLVYPLINDGLYVLRFVYRYSGPEPEGLKIYREELVSNYV